MKARFGWSLMTLRPSISSVAMSSCKTVRATRGETKAQHRDNVVFSKRREGVTPGGCRNDLGGQFQIAAVGAAQTSFRRSAGSAHLAAQRDRPDLTFCGLAHESDRSIRLRSRKGGVR